MEPCTQIWNHIINEYVYAGQNENINKYHQRHKLRFKLIVCGRHNEAIRLNLTLSHNHMHAYIHNACWPADHMSNSHECLPQCYSRKEYQPHPSMGNTPALPVLNEAEPFQFQLLRNILAFSHPTPVQGPRDAVVMTLWKMGGRDESDDSWVYSENGTCPATLAPADDSSTTIRSAGVWKQAKCRMHIYGTYQKPSTTGFHRPKMAALEFTFIKTAVWMLI